MEEMNDSTGGRFPAQPQEIPEGTYWPIAMAGGLFLFFLGLITTWIILVAGLAVTGVSFAGWLEDFNHG